jgi:hypothetical protein
MGNAFLEKQKAIQDERLQEAFLMGFQKCYDLMRITLNDKETMRNDTFGAKRITRICEGLFKWEEDFHDAFLAKPGADYLKERLDKRLQQIYKDETVPPFEKRYPSIKTYKYKRGGK